MIAINGSDYEIVIDGHDYEIAIDGHDYEVAIDGSDYEIAIDGHDYEIAIDGHDYVIVFDVHDYETAINGCDYEIIIRINMVLTFSMQCTVQGDLEAKRIHEEMLVSKPSEKIYVEESFHVTNNSTGTLYSYLAPSIISGPIFTNYLSLFVIICSFRSNIQKLVYC